MQRGPARLPGPAAVPRSEAVFVAHGLTKTYHAGEVEVQALRGPAAGA